MEGFKNSYLKDKTLTVLYVPSWLDSGTGHCLMAVEGGRDADLVLSFYLPPLLLRHRHRQRMPARYRGTSVMRNSGPPWDSTVGKCLGPYGGPRHFPTPTRQRMPAGNARLLQGLGCRKGTCWFARGAGSRTRTTRSHKTFGYLRSGICITGVPRS